MLGIRSWGHRFGGKANEFNADHERKSHRLLYQVIFDAENRTASMPNLNINIEKRPMEIDNAKLQCLPTEEEVRTALTSMPAGKAPGMDRTTSEILTFYWSTIKNDVTTTILHFFGTKRML